MDLSSKLNRVSLRSFFEAGDIPTESNFSSLIDGMLNHAEDKIAKIGGNPVSLEAEGAGDTDQHVLDLYRDFSQEAADWSISLNPLERQGGTRRNPGLNIHNANTPSSLFIDADNGNVGIGTVRPHAKLSVIDNGDALALGSDREEGHVYMALYPNGLEEDELGYVGFRRDNDPEFRIHNEKSNGRMRLSTEDSITLSARGGTFATHSFSAQGNINNGGFDFTLGTSDQSSRGNSGASRALVKDRNATLVINYGNDFRGGTIINGGSNGITLNSNRAFGVVRDQGNRALRIASGRSQPSDWEDYSTTGITAVIDTSSAGFTSTPVYFASLQGTGGHWEANGATSIYSPSRNSFRVYLRSIRDNVNYRVRNATNSNWYITWIAIGI